MNFPLDLGITRGNVALLWWIFCDFVFLSTIHFFLYTKQVLLQRIFYDFCHNSLWAVHIGAAPPIREKFARKSSGGLAFWVQFVYDKCAVFIVPCCCVPMGWRRQDDCHRERWLSG